MQRTLLRLAACAGLLLAGVPARAQTHATPTPAKPGTSPEPRVSTVPDNTRYLNRPALVKGCMARLDAANAAGGCDIIFIGDSITEAWMGNGKVIWQKIYAPRKALDFGISGDKTQNVLWRLENMNVKGLKPKVAVILIGTNNYGNEPEEIAAGVKAVVEKTRSTFPGVKTALLGILPNKRAPLKMEAANKLIRPLADEKTVFFVDLGAKMTPVVNTGKDGKPDPNWKGLLPDHLHLTPEGYQMWADTLEPVLAKLLAQ